MNQHVQAAFSLETKENQPGSSLEKHIYFESYLWGLKGFKGTLIIK